MKRHGFVGCLLAVILLIGLSPMTSMAQAPTQREQELEKTVQQLLQRVEELENRLDQQEAKKDNSQDATPQAATGTPAGPESATTQDSAAPKGNPNEIKTTWKNGLNFESADGAHKLHIGGRIQSDWFAGSIDDGDFPDGTRFRRVWLDLSGNVYDDIEFKVQYDISGGGTNGFKDVYMGYTGFDFAKIRVGQFREPFNLEELTANNYITFMERSPINMFAPSRETGLMLHNQILDGRMSWAVGAFKNADDFGDSDEDDAEEGNWDVAARVTGTPWFEDGGKRLLHLGLSGVHRDWSDDVYRLRSRGSFSKGDRLIDAGDIQADSIDQIGAEMALVYGPASLQGEYMFANVEETQVGSDQFDGFYVQASYFLTGETRPYKEGIFTRVKPANNFSMKNGGWGAWEAAFRYSNMDLSDTSNLIAKGGKLDDYALGLNWYLNPNTRMMWNYIHSESSDTTTGDQDADVIQMRLQIDF